MWKKLSKKIKILISFVYGMLFISYVLTMLRTIIMGSPYVGEWTLLLAMIMLGIFTTTNIVLVCCFMPNKKDAGANNKNSNKLEKRASIIVHILLFILLFYNSLKLYTGLDFASWISWVEMSLAFVLLVICISMMIKKMIGKEHTE